METDKLIALKSVRDEEAVNPNQGDERMSVLSNSRKGEEELFDDLEKFNDNYEPSYYQSEFKRFETSNNLNHSSTSRRSKEIETPQPQPRRIERSSSRRASFSSKSKKHASAYKKNISLRDKILKHRIVCRLISLTCILSILSIIIVVSYTLGMYVVTYTATLVDKEVQIELQDCRLFIHTCTSDCSKHTFEIDYRSSPKTIVSQGLSLNSNIDFEETGQKVTLKVKHLDDIRSCNVNFFVHKSLNFKKLTIACKHTCTIIQEQDHLQVEELSITGEEVSTNFAHLDVGNLNFYSDKGYFQVNHLALKTGSYSRNVTLAFGDIILETTDSLRASFTSAMENYCLAGPTTTQVTAPSKTALEYPLLKWRTEKFVRNNMFIQQTSGTVDMCSTTVCNTGLPVLSLYNMDGNIYINVHKVIPAVVADDYQVFKGSTYGYSIELPLSAREKITTSADLTNQSNLPNLILRLMFGNIDAWSQHSQRWVYVDHPLFATIKPWWLSFFTLGKLVENSNEIKTYFSPGYCPLKPVRSSVDNKLVYLMLHNYLSSSRGVLSLQKLSTEDLEPDQTKPRSGFTSFANFSFFSDEWVKVKVIDGTNDVYKLVYLTENSSVFFMMILSIILSGCIAIYLAIKLASSFIKSIEKARKRCHHIEFYLKIYARVVNSNTKETYQSNYELEEEAEKLNINSFTNMNIRPTASYQQLPSTTAYIDYLMFIFFSTKHSSLSRFFEIAFEASEPGRNIDITYENVQKERVPFIQLKSLYQQMCFLMDYREHSLSSQESIDMLKQRGMIIANSDTHRQYLIRLVMNNSQDLSLSYLKNDKNQTSLEIFLDKFCEQTNFDEDKIPLETFIERYSVFCKLNHMEQVLTDHIILKKKFGIMSKTIVKEMVERDYERIYFQQLMRNPSLVSKIVYYVKSLFWKRYYYTIKPDRIKNINLYLAGKLSENDVGKKEFTKILNIAMLEKYWWLRDFISVLMELLLIAVQSSIFLTIFVYQEIEHSLYSVRDESINIYGFNLSSSDIWLLPAKVPACNADVQKWYPYCSIHSFHILLDKLHHQHHREQLERSVSHHKSVRSIQTGISNQKNTHSISVVDSIYS